MYDFIFVDNRLVIFAYFLRYLSFCGIIQMASNDLQGRHKSRGWTHYLHRYYWPIVTIALIIS